jgi:hypothetical protein
MKYVVQNNYGAFLCDPSRNDGKSWTRDVRKAKRFASQEDARKECKESDDLPVPLA